MHLYLLLLSIQPDWAPRGVEDMLQKLRVLKEMLQKHLATLLHPKHLKGERLNNIFKWKKATKEVLLPDFFRSLYSYLP